MKTYAVVYRFADEQAAEEFKKSTIDAFRNIHEKDSELFHYIGFSSGEEPEVEDKVSGIVRDIQYKGLMSDGDYIGVYFSPDNDPDTIKRQMAFGTDESIENDVTPNYQPEHISIITDLLEYDPVKEGR